MTSDEFWDELRNNPKHPKTSQPTPNDFRRQYQVLATHYESAISIHLPAKTSGTYQSAITASRALTNFPTSIIDGNCVSIGTGLIAIRAAEAIDDGKSMDEVIKIVEQAKSQTKIYILLDSLDSAVKGGRVQKYKKTVADTLRISPILSIGEDGSVVTNGKLIGKRNIDDRFIKYVGKKIDVSKLYRIGIVHGNCEERARKFEKHYINAIGKENVFFSQIGPGLGTHAGTNAIAIAVQKLD
jgi:DegV family protein with EDD domain